MGNVDLDQVEEWISLLHGASDGYVHICSTQSWTGRAFPVSHIELMKSYVQWLDAQGTKGIYLRLTTIQDPNLAPGSRGSDDDSHTLPGLWADLDIAGPGHKTNKPLPPSEDEARRIVAESGLPEPSIWMHSGGGMYAWWLLDNPIDVTNPATRESAQGFSARWQDVLTATAERIGYSYGGLGDLSRVTRIPGTVNRKIEDAPAACRMLESSGRLYSAKELASALDAAEARVAELAPPKPAAPPPIPQQRTAATGPRPGDELAERLEWAEILEPAGYQFDRRQGEEDYWVRPGKNRRDGHSCTTNYRGSGLLYVFSTEMDGFEANESYTKFATWAILNGYGRDFKAASKALRAQGYGSQRQATSPPQPLQPRQVPDGGGAAVPEAPQVVVHSSFPLSDVGNARRLAATVGDRFRYVGAQSEWMRWNGQVWEVDDTAAVNRAAVAVTDEILREADRFQESSDDHDPDAKLCRCYGCKLAKHGTASQANGKIKGMVEQFSMIEGIATAPRFFDQPANLLTVGNGTLNLDTEELLPFDSRFMLTRQMPVSYDPQATCPKFEAFLAQVLPSEALRDYVQRALGYTLTGENDQRALFLVHGPSGTGKSQFLSIMEKMFGDFGGTAEANTFRETRSESTHDLHMLRGKRFVTTSETSDSARLDEELVKRVTGGDNVTTRALYQQHITWRPEFTIWMATNFPPKMNSDDGAVWARYKPIHFGVQFSREQAQPNIGAQIVAEEAAGILNWLLAGLAKYRQHGLGEPEEVVAEVAEHQFESDNVAQFIADALTEGLLVENKLERISSMELFHIYDQWCQRQRIRAYGQKRFTNRMRSLGKYEQVKDSRVYWVGLARGGHVGFLGRMG